MEERRGGLVVVVVVGLVRRPRRSRDGNGGLAWRHYDDPPIADCSVQPTTRWIMGPAHYLRGDGWTLARIRHPSVGRCSPSQQPLPGGGHRGGGAGTRRRRESAPAVVVPLRHQIQSNPKMSSPCLFIHHSPFLPRPLASSSCKILRTLRLPAATRRPPGAREEADDGFIPIARCYESPLARLDISGAARREQAVAAAAAADGGAAAEAHLAAGSDAMVMQAFLPVADDDRTVASTRLILQANQVKDKASKMKNDIGPAFFSEHEPDSSETVLAMAFKQVVMHRISNFQLEVFSPGSEKDFQQNLSKPRKVSIHVSISSADEKLLSSLAEAIFSCAIEDARKDFLGNKGSLLQKRQLSCSTDSSVCIHRISEAEVVNNAKKCLESFTLMKSSHQLYKPKNEWWPAPNYKSLVKLGGPEPLLWVNEYIPSYKLQINVKAFHNTRLEGLHELANSRWEVLLSHFQLVELGNVLDMYFEDQFTLPGKTFHPQWNSDPSKIKRGYGYLKNIYPFLAGSCIVLFVGITAQLCWPQTLRGKRLSHVSSSQSTCSDIHFLDESEIQAYCTSIVRTIKDSFGFSADIMVDTNIGAWVGDLPECFVHISSKNSAASDEVQHPNGYSQETLQNVASFQVVMSEEGRVVGFQPTNRLAVNHWATNPLATRLYEGRALSPAFLEPRLKISRPSKLIATELLMSVKSESFFALARPVQGSS